MAGEDTEGEPEVDAADAGAFVVADDLPDGVLLPSLGVPVVEVASEGGTVTRFEPSARCAVERQGDEVLVRLETGASWHRVGHDAAEYAVRCRHVTASVVDLEVDLEVDGGGGHQGVGGRAVFFLTAEPDGSCVVGVVSGAVSLSSTDRADLRVSPDEVVLVGPSGVVAEVVQVGKDELAADAWVARNRPLDASLPGAGDAAPPTAIDAPLGTATPMDLPFATDDEPQSASERRSEQVVGLVGRDRSTRVVRGSIVLVCLALVALLLYSASRQDDFEPEGISQVVTDEPPTEPPPQVPDTTEPPPPETTTTTEEPAPETTLPPETTVPDTTVAPTSETTAAELTTTTAVQAPAGESFVNERYRAELTSCTRRNRDLDITGTVENREGEDRSYRVTVALRDPESATVARAVADVDVGAGGVERWQAIATPPDGAVIAACELESIEPV